MANQSGGALQVGEPLKLTGAVEFAGTNTFSGATTVTGLLTSSGGLTLSGTTTIGAGSTITSPVLTTPTISGGTQTLATESGNINTDYKVLAASITYDSKPAAAVITGFSWTVVAGATYEFDVLLNTTMTTVGGLTASFKLTTATLTSIQYLSYASTATDNADAVSTQGTTTTDATAIFDSKTAAYTYVRLQGTFVVNAGGTFAFFATQNTSGTAGNVTIIKLGSYALLTRTL